jgi:phage-related minor tail protein
MTSIAELGIRVNSAEAAQAANDLDKLAQSGAKAEKSTEGLRKTTEKSKKTFEDLGAGAKGAEKSTEGLTKQTDKLGISAKQTAAALRGVPAQFTDIAVSLQGGQAPLTVLLQQGGQLKDMFGGVGPAARALGGYVAGLVNPFTLAAAAALALAVAYNKGSQEADAYNKSLILTGKVAGTTADALGTMARDVSATVGTTGAAADVLAQLAGSGKIATDSFEAITVAALSMQQATGKAAEETVAEFVKIGKDPVAAAKELNDQYHFLTQSIYSQIVAMKESGDAAGAAKLLTDTYADTIRNRTAEVTGNLGLIERAWLGIKNAALGALDAALDVGRDETLGEQLTAAKKRLADLTAGGRDAAKEDPFRYESTIKEIGYLEMQIEAEKLLSKFVGDRQRTQDAGVAASERVDALTRSTLTNEQKRGEEIKKYKADLDKIRAANPDDSRLAQATVDKNIANINERYKDPKVVKAPAYREDAAAKMLQSLRDQEAVLQAQVTGNDKLTAAQKAQVQWAQQLSDLKGKSILTADQKSLLANKDVLSAQIAQNVALDEQIRKREQANELERLRINILQSSGQREAANAAKIELDYAKQKLEYEREGNVEALARLETLRQTQLANDKAGVKRGTVEGVSAAPNSPGLDASVGGANSEIDRLNESAAALDDWRTTEIQKQAAFLEAKAISEETYAARIANIDQQAQAERTRIESAKNSALLIASSDFFGNMAVLSQSGNSKLAAIGKAAAIAQTTIATYKSATESYAALAGIPVIGPALGFAAAGAAITAGLANVAAITGVGFKTGGYTGDVGTNDVAGVVHGKEYVFDAAATARIGKSNLDAIRAGKMEAPSPAGIYTGSGPGAAANDSKPAAPGGVIVNLHEDASRAGQVQTSTAPDGRQQMDAFISNIRQQGQFAKTLEQTYDLKRRGR